MRPSNQETEEGQQCGPDGDHDTRYCMSGAETASKHRGHDNRSGDDELDEEDTSRRVLLCSHDKEGGQHGRSPEYTSPEVLIAQLHKHDARQVHRVGKEELTVAGQTRENNHTHA